jgi:hypothetical protein
VNENFRLVMVNTPEDKKGVGSGIFNAANNLSMVFGVCAFQIIFSVFAGTADVPDPSGMAFSGISIETLSKAFSSIFIFGGILYLMTIIFSLLAERTSIDKNP